MAPTSRVPVGGILQMYDMAEGLDELGFDAYVWHAEPEFRCQWLASAARIVGAPRLHLVPGDVLVVPEYQAVAAADRFATARLVVLNQHHFNTFVGGGLGDTWPGAYPGLANATAVIVPSRATERFVMRTVGRALPVFRVRCQIDGHLFAPGAKLKVIAFMSRRSPIDLESVVQLIHRSPTLRDWELREIAGLSHRGVADAMSDAAIFLSLTDRDGFGRPPAEAMAAGCYVIGFDGGGGAEYMSPEWCSPIAFPNYVALVEEIERVAQVWSLEPGAITASTDRARDRVVATYERPRFLSDLANAFAALTDPSSPARQSDRIEVTHYKYVTRTHRLLAPVRPWVPDGVVRSVRSARARASGRRLS